ncbi:UNKNOWN [Stylonychia lemnae]|uniref:Uncharacterized protein n=1 Tax=Stylonychia lemnae TaxID=5949 RepID=A0A078BF98_STYLE|nr:UNKNOWN [Stylonychia lemnae]|eukprot:CDW91812.1 UNKNOWN [Stylonychia lemnae]
MKQSSQDIEQQQEQLQSRMFNIQGGELDNYNLEQQQQHLVNLQNPQIIDNNKIQVVKATSFDFEKIKKGKRKRHHNKTLGSQDVTALNVVTSQKQERQSSRVQSSQQKTRPNNIQQLMNQNCTKFEECKPLQFIAQFLDVKLNSQQTSVEDEILSRSVLNSALTSSRLQKQEFDSRLKPQHNMAMDSLLDLANHNQNNPSQTGQLYPVLQVREEQDESDNSPLKAMQIARRQSLLKQKGMNLTSRRESFFGSQHTLTPDPLQKLLQTKKYLKNDLTNSQGLSGNLQIQQQPSFSGQFTERLNSRQESNGGTTVLSLVNNKNHSTNGTFKNEYLQKTLNQTLEVESMNNDHSRNRSNIDALNKSSEINKSTQYLRYRERLFLKNLTNQSQLKKKSFTRSNTFNGNDTSPAKSQSFVQLNQHDNSLALVLPQLGKTPTSLVNDTVQQALVLDHINDYNRDCNKYNSVLIHLGVLLKKAISQSEQGHQLPCFFLTTSIYYQYDAKKHFKEDEIELDQNKDVRDLTKKDAKVKVKYLRYETFHDKLVQAHKENKQLKREMLRMKKDYRDDQCQRLIIKNLVDKLRAQKEKENQRKIFNALRFHSNNKYQGLFANVMANSLFGSDIKARTLARKYFVELKLYTLESKLRKARKEIEYYQNKTDDLDDNNSSQRVQIKDLVGENTRLKSQLNQKQQQLAVHENDNIQYKADTSKNKPQQIKECLKIYFKYIFTNPLIARLRIRKPMALFALSHTKVDESSIQNNQQRRINMSLLLKKKETIYEGGPGVQLLMNMSLKEIMVRWSNFMIERAVLKLNPIIEILQREVQKRKQRRINSRLNTAGPMSGQQKQQEIIQEQDASSSSSNSDIEDSKREQSKNLNEEAPDDEIKLPIEEKNDVKQAIFLNYEPFKNYKNDLKLLITFKQMVSKLVSDFSLNMINDGVMQAILFSLDQAERSLEILNMNTTQALNTPGSVSRASTAGFPGRLVKGYSYQEEPFEEVIVPDFKYILQYVNNTNIEDRTKLLMEQIEIIQSQKFDWYFSLSEMLTGKEQNYTTTLLYLFYSYMRKVNSHLHDVSLLYSIDEFNKEESTALQQLHELPYMNHKQLMIRWVNHLLRSYHELKLQNELEQKFRKRFQQPKPEDKDKSQERSPSRNTIASRQSAAISNSLKQKLQRKQDGNNRNAQNNNSNSNNTGNRGDQTSKSLPRVGTQTRNKKQIAKEESEKKLKFGITKDSKTQNIIREYNLNPDLQHLGFEITKIGQLSQENYHRLILILAYLTPETIWDMNDMDYRELKRTSHYIEIVEAFLIKSTLDQKILFIMNAITRITKKNNLISIDDLYQKSKIEYLDLLIELFLSRPNLKDFNKQSYEEIEIHSKKLIDQKDEITECFAFVQDCDRIYQTLKEKLLQNKLSFPNPNTIIARQMNIFERSELLLSDIEKSITNLNKQFLFQLLTFRQQQQGQQWALQLEDVIKKFIYPLRRYLNVYMDQEGFITYFDMWRAIKSLNIRSFVLDSREVENLMIKLIKLKDSRLVSRRTVNMSKDEELSLIREDFQDEVDLFMKKIKSEIQYTVFSSKKQATKSSIVKEIEESLENIYVKTQLYRAKFQPSDLILILIAILFRQNPSEFVQEIIKITPSLYEEGVKNVNKMLSKEKIQIHVEAYLTEYQPHLLFEQFLIHNVLIKSDFSKKHPFRINMMKEDFRQFLDHYLNSLFAVFDFYLHEYATTCPQPIKYKHFCIQIEAIYGLLRDFNAFNPESGLSKNNLRKILINVQKQTSNDKLYQERQQLKTAGTIDQALNSQGMTPNKTVQFTMSNVIKSPSQFNKQILNSSVTSNQENQIQFLIENFESLVFFEFMECLYLVSQYHSPDPFINPNQKFAEFLERVVFTNIQFKIKSKRIMESPHKNNLIRSLQNHRVIRGASLETFNSYFDLH